ncbi:MAG TPA: hypothetical protein VND87_01360 [Stellaceae bacterium]|nr:hypothetical protein [Stellaceae bacterium]
MHNSGRRQAFVVVLALLALLVAAPAPSDAQSLFGEHYVDVQFATRDGKPMASAEVLVFAPGKPDRPVQVGRTDKDGKFRFEADEDGFWSAEAHTGTEIARVTIRVGHPDRQPGWLESPYVILGLLCALLALAVVFRYLRARERARARSRRG